MCAVNGFSWSDRGLGIRMNKATAHRGPDATGVFIEEGVTLGHNRLSIIDLSDVAAQPMTDSSGRFVIIYNGELYNFKDIKKELSGYVFKSQSDTEVILAAYQKWGSKMLEKFNGIFAFAIWDRRKQELFLARDQMGVKPLYYYQENNKLIFSSEIKAILEHDVRRKLNIDAFNHYMRLLYVPEPFTLFDGINKFPQAHYGIYKDGQLTLTKYWHLEARPPSEKRPEELREKVGKAVERQLVSDRPLGLYLSGGIDSSAVLASMSAVRNDIDTFSVGFELDGNEQSEKFNADFELARRTAKYFGTRHHEVFVKSADLIETLEQALWQLDEPIVNSTVIPQLILSHFTKEYATVVLTGDGGDELFGGYPRYLKSRILDYFPISISVEKRILRFMSQKDNILSRVISPNYFKQEITRDYFKKNFEKCDGNITEALMRIDRQSWLVDEALSRTDKLNMAHGVEARVPFLDRELVEYSATIPINQKVSLFNTKIILKEAFKKDLPDFLFNQPKRGFFSPSAKWLRRPDFLVFTKSVLSPTFNSNTEELFNWSNIAKMFDEHITKRGYFANPLWAILAFQLWAKKYRVEL
ncbi:MAG TPA: asparagine synthase (glutamine-hydrolyzing) [Candidatus Paceibacterota bacterium]